MLRTPASAPALCTHCGDTCSENSYKLSDTEVFCCNGCQQAYLLLQESGLCEYYREGEFKGLKPEQNHRYAYLNEPEARLTVADYADDEMTHITFSVPGMHCASCIWILENLHRLHPGVKSAKVNFPAAKVKIKFAHDELPAGDLAALLAKIGYAPTPPNEAEHKAGSTTKDRSAVYKIGIAGFAFGNIMFLSLPEYFAEGSFEDIKEFVPFFGYISLFLCLPVVFYSASDYFKSAWAAIKARHINIDIPIAVGIAVIFAATIIEIVQGRGNGYADSLCGLLFFLLLGKFFQQQTFRRLAFDRDYTAYFPLSALKVEGNQTVYTPVARLQPGDTILVRPEELIPADALCQSETTEIDYAFVTGEQLPVTRMQGDAVYAGGRQKGLSAYYTITKPASQSYLTSLWNDETFKKDKHSSVSLFSDLYAKYFTIIILLVALGALLYWLPQAPDTAVKAFVSVLIVACPCASALAVPFTLGNTLRMFGKEKFYLKNTAVLEKMATTDLAVFDKTGTLTKANHLPARQGDYLTEHELVLIKSAMAQSVHPLSKAIADALTAPLLPVSRYTEVTGKGARAIVKGQEIVWGNADITGAPHTTAPANFTKVHVAVDGHYKGYYYFKNIYREGIAGVFQHLHQSAIKTAVLSGDNDSERHTLELMSEGKALLSFNNSPAGKLEFIKKAKMGGKNVMMLGDGLNDAGALMESSVGIAVTEKTGLFTPACDAIMDAEVIHRLPQFIVAAQKALGVVKLNYAVSVLYNVAGLAFAVQGVLSPVVCAVLMPVSSFTVIALSLLLTKNIAKS